MNYTFTLLILALMLGFEHAQAEEKDPLFEINLGAGVGSVADYPASAQHHIRTIVLPYITYRGEKISADHEGVQADVVKRATLGIDASVGLSLPSSSDYNTARSGMPDIDTLLEIGPRLYLLIPTDNQHDFRLVFPMRGVVSTNLKTWTDRGLLFAPGFLYKIALKPNGKSSLTTSFGVNFGTNRLTEYFYQVDPEFAQPDRPAYRTRAGYIGTRTSVIYSISAGRFRYFTSIGAQSYKNAANADSPLFRKNYDATIIGGIVWSFFKSDARAYR